MFAAYVKELIADKDIPLFNVFTDRKIFIHRVHSDRVMGIITQPMDLNPTCPTRDSQKYERKYSRYRASQKKLTVLISTGLNSFHATKPKLLSSKVEAWNFFSCLKHLCITNCFAVITISVILHVLSHFMLFSCLGTNVTLITSLLYCSTNSVGDKTWSKQLRTSKRTRL